MAAYSWLSDQNNSDGDYGNFDEYEWDENMDDHDWHNYEIIEDEADKCAYTAPWRETCLTFDPEADPWCEVHYIHSPC